MQMHHIGTREITTERLVLNRLTAEDVDSISQWSSDPSVYEYLSAYPKSRPEVERVVANIVDSYSRSDVYYWAIRLQGKPGVVGVIFVDAVFERSCMCDVEFLLSRQQWGCGYAEEALRAVISYLFAGTECHRVQAKVPISHRAGEITLHRVGMFREGVLRESYMDKSRPDSWMDMVIYGVLDYEWKN